MTQRSACTTVELPKWLTILSQKYKGCLDVVPIELHLVLKVQRIPSDAVTVVGVYPILTLDFVAVNRLKVYPRDVTL
jgi:hypothetical protein